MKPERTLATCSDCGEEREMAAHGLCFKCYRASERAAENPWAAADRHNRGQLKQIKKLRKCITSILNSLDDGIDVLNPEDVDAVRSIVQPYFVSLAAGLAPVREEAANSEQNVKNDVHCSQDSPNTAEIKSEQGEENDVHSSLLASEPAPVEIETAAATADELKPESEHTKADDVQTDMPETGKVIVPSLQQETATVPTDCENYSTTTYDDRPALRDAAEQGGLGSLIPVIQTRKVLEVPPTSSPEQAGCQMTPVDTSRVTKIAKDEVLAGKYLVVRPHPKGGYGIYVGDPAKCVQRHQTREKAWDAVTAANHAAFFGESGVTPSKTVDLT